MLEIRQNHAYMCNKEIGRKMPNIFLGSPQELCSILEPLSLLLQVNNKKLDWITAFITTNKNNLTPKILVLILQFR